MMTWEAPRISPGILDIRETQLLDALRREGEQYLREGNYEAHKAMQRARRMVFAALVRLDIDITEQRDWETTL